MDIVGRRTLFYTISGLLVAASIAALAVFGLKPGIDFTGGSLLELEFQGERPSAAALREALAPMDLGEVRLQPTGERGFLIRLKPIDEETHQELLRRLSNPGPGTPSRGSLSERRFDAIGPTIGAELRRKSLLSLSLVVLLILVYIAWAFRKVSRPAGRGSPAPGTARPVGSWMYGLITILALLHDVTIPTGVFAVLGATAGFEADTLFVAALLTILGFSVHDTIVVFDRIRENLKQRPGMADFAGIVNAAVNQTLVRSVNTSLTVLLAVIAIYLFGGEATRFFALTLALGVIVGTYSSIFIASPLLVTWHHWQVKRQK